MNKNENVKRNLVNIFNAVFFPQNSYTDLECQFEIPRKSAHSHIIWIGEEIRK